MKERPSYAYSERLMKQMGWTEGKGLGKNENGSPDFIRPKKKVNTKGIGFTGVDDRWIEHQEAFDSLLSNLNDGNPAAKEDKLISVEERAFKLGGRVHYSKFLRGKDLSQKKEEELNAIVVKRTNKKDLESVQGADVSGQEDLSGVKTHTSSISYQEYFAQRMKASKRRKGLNENGDSQFSQKSEETVNCSRGEDSEIKSGKKSKAYEKNTYAQNERTPCTDDDVFVTRLALNGVYTEDAGSLQDANFQPKKKKKKSKDKSGDGSRSQCSQMSVEQQDERIMEDPAEVAAIPEEPCWEGGASKRQRKVKHDDSEQTLHEATTSCAELYSEDGVSRKVKRKSRHKSRDSGESEAFETVTSTAEWTLDEEVPRRRKKSKRRAENVAENDEQDAPETTVSEMDFHTENSAPQVKKKSKLKPDHGSANQRLQANGSEQRDDGDCRSETDPSSTKHSVKEDVPKQTKKPKRQPSPNGSLKPQTATVFPSMEFCSVEQQQVKKKSKHRPTASVVEQGLQETSSKKAAVTDLKDKAAKKEALLPLLEPCFEEDMPKRATRKPKLKASTVLDETGELKGHTESAEDTTAVERCLGRTSPSASGQCEALFKQRGQLKKLKRDPADEEYEQVGERGTSKAAVLDANTEELSKDCEHRKPKRKPEKKEKKGAAESSQLQEVAAKKCEQEQEQNDENENQIGGARVKTKTVLKQKPKEDTLSSERNPQQEQTNQNTKGNKRPKQGLEGIAAPKKCRSEQVVQTSNTPLKKLKGGEKSSGSKLKQKEGTTTKPAAKKHVKDASKLVAKNSEATATKPVSEEPVLGPRPTFVPGNRQRNTRAGNAASTHGKGCHPCPVACSLDKLERGIWMHYFKPNFNVRAIDSDDTAASMAQWVVDTAENSGAKVTPYKACHLDKEMYAMMLSDHIYRWHSSSNWMQIPGYGSDFWVQGIVNNLVSKMLLKRQKDASSSASRVVE